MIGIIFCLAGLLFALASLCDPSSSGLYVPVGMMLTTIGLISNCIPESKKK